MIEGRVEVLEMGISMHLGNPSEYISSRLEANAHIARYRNYGALAVTEKV